MSFKAFISSTAIAGTLITGTMVVSAPAEAATIVAGSVLNLSNPDVFGGGVRRVGNTLDFYSLSFTNPFTGNRFYLGQRVNVSDSTGSFEDSNIASLFPPLPTIDDLALVATGNPVLFAISGPITGFIEGVNLADGFPPSSVRFDLTSFIWNSTTGDADLRGVFVSGSDSIAAVGRFTSQLSGANPSSYSLSIEAVPTPALLPGLIGMGIAALRRKKEEAEENA
jgi:hypothetical protein